ncbi:21039_t:CDS:2, partial [Dentiscutata erythropus]
CQTPRSNDVFKKIKDRLAKTCNFCLDKRQLNYQNTKNSNIKKPLIEITLDINILSQIIDEITKTENTEEFEIIVQFGILNLSLNETTKFIREQIENGNGYKW